MNYSRIIFGMAAAGAGAVSLSSMFGLLDVLPWVEANLGKLLLFISGVILSAIVALDHRLMAVERHSERASRRSLEDSLDQVEANLPKELRQLFSPFLNRWVDRLKEAAQNNTVLIEPVDQFPVFYIETLRAFPKETFYATSLPFRRYFWKNDAAFVAMKKFVQGGGTMTRIFFINSNREEAELYSIVDDQLTAGIRVISVESSQIPSEWRQLFVVSHSKNLAWIVRTAADVPEIESTHATADPTLVEAFRKTFQSLISHPSAREWYKAENGSLTTEKVRH